MKKHIRSVFAATLLVSSLLASGAMAQDMGTVVKLTVENNPQIGTVSANRKAVEQELRQARGLYLPQVDVVTGIGPENTNNITTRSLGNDDDTYIRSDARISLTQRLYAGGQVTHEVERQKQRVAAAANRVSENSENIALDAVGSYLEVIRQRELFALAKQNVDFHNDILGKLQQRLNSGVGTQADVAQTRARQARSLATLSQTGNDLGDAESVYTRVTGQFPGELARPSFPVASLPQSLDQAVKMASEDAPGVHAADSDVQAAKEEIGLAEAGYLPTVNIEADAGYSENANGEDTYDHDARVLLRGRWNLFRGGIDRANRQEAVFRTHQYREQRSRVVNEQVEQARRSWFAYQSSAQRVDQLKAAVEDLKSTRSAYQQQFDIGQRTLLDLLDAENELFTARGQLVSADINQLVSGYRLLASTGSLLKTMQIAAPSTSNPKAETFGQSMAIE
jgi:adhesin transport system outer membrane protein